MGCGKPDCAQPIIPSVFSASRARRRHTRFMYRDEAAGDKTDRAGGTSVYNSVMIFSSTVMGPGIALQTMGTETASRDGAGAEENRSVALSSAEAFDA